MAVAAAHRYGDAPMFSTLTRPTRLLLSIALLLAFAAGMTVSVVTVIDACDGRLISWLDDAYIHMAMARTLTEHSVYGLTPREFASASSSPLWVLALSMAYAVFGVDEIVAFALNILAAIGLLLVAAFLVGPSGSGWGDRVWQLAALAGFALLAGWSVRLVGRPDAGSDTLAG